MQPRKSIYSDGKHMINIYSEGNYDPDQYTIWFEGLTRVVMRKPMESAIDLYRRVCEVVYQMQHAPHVRFGPYAHVFAGIKPSPADIKHLQTEQLRQVFRTLMLNGKTSKERINAAVGLAKLIGIYPPEVKRTG